MPELEVGENIVYTLRRHWIVFVSRTLFFLAVIILPLFILVLLETFIANNFDFEIYESYIWFGYIIWVFFTWISYVFSWTDYYLDVWVITNRRIIDIEQKAVFHREVSSFRIEKIQDVTIETKGILATFLHYGDLRVQTAGEHVEFVIKQAANPELVKAKINELQGMIQKTF